MALGKWSRWGRGICEGYTLELGSILRADIVWRERHFTTSVNGISCGTHDTFEDAVKAVEKDVRYHVQFFLESLEKYREAPAPKRKAGRRR